MVLLWAKFAGGQKGLGMEQIGEVLQTLFWVCLLCYVVPAIIIVIVGALLLRRGNQYLQESIAPDMEKIQAEFDRLRTQKPNVATDALVRGIIHRQALRSGVVGAVTGIGGFVTLPIALPIDLYASAQLQANMVSFIALAYGHKTVSPVEQRVLAYLITTGSAHVTQTTIAYVLRTVVRLLGKTLSKLVPVIGAVISFIINYVLTQAVGRIAVERYKYLGEAPV